MRALRLRLRLAALVTTVACAASAQVSLQPPITFSTEFEGGSLGKIEHLGPTQFRCHVRGQYDERGHNRQTSWYFFRLDAVQGRDISITLTDLVGEYNDRPGACPMSEDIRPVCSDDGERWRHCEQMSWDPGRHEATLRFRPERSSLWIAHAPPYTWSRLRQLVDEADRHPSVCVESIGRSVRGRDLVVLRVTDPEARREGKRVAWLVTRQHAWESGTSWVFEGAVKRLISDTPRARDLRARLVLYLVPTMDPDGCVSGQVRFNAHGYDLNRHWGEVDLIHKSYLEQMPELWYFKKAIVQSMREPGGIDLFLNLHNTETGEFLETPVDEPRLQTRMARLFQWLSQESHFDPSQPLRAAALTDPTTHALWRTHRVPVVLMEQRIGSSAKLGRRPTVEDRLAFGAEIVEAMAKTLLEDTPPGAPGR